MFNKRYIAVDIGNSTTKIVQGSGNKDEIIVNEYEIVKTPENAIKDGKITNLKILVNLIEGVLKNIGIKDKNLVLTVSGTGVITRDIQIPKSTEDEIEKMLEFEAQQYFPVDLENYVLDFKVLEEVTVNNVVYSRVLLVAVPIKQIEEYMKLPGSLKMEISAIDLPANCVLKTLPKKEPAAAKEFAIVDIGADTTGVCIFYGGTLKFNRILLNGGNYIDMLVANEHGMDIKEAENIKIGIGKVNNDGDRVEGTEKANETDETIKTAANSLISDINRFIEFYNSRSAANKLDTIYLCGGGSNLKGLPKHMQAILNIPVELIRPPAGIAYKGKKKQERFQADFSILINAIGALVRT